MSTDQALSLQRTADRYRHERQSNEAITAYERSRSIWQEFDDSFGVAFCNLGIALCKKQLNDRPAALSYFQRSLGFFENVSPTHPRYDESQRVVRDLTANIASLRAGESGTQLDDCSQLFKRDHRHQKTVFIMMKFAGGNSSHDAKLSELYNAISLELRKYGLDAVRADEKNYSNTDYMWDNVQVYLNGCDYGIAVLEELYGDEMNPNIALEYGYMLALGKRVLLLKQESFHRIRADILGKKWKEFEFDSNQSIQKSIQAWMVDLGIARIRA